jgi:hypothetical protein
MDKNNREIDFLDILTLVDFYISVLNYNENISQSQMQDTVNDAIEIIQDHLKKQDQKIDRIIELLKGGDKVE